MARSRNIKPAFFQNDELAELDPIERLCFIGLWTICDYRGCLEYRPKKIKAQVLPYDNVDIEKIAINLDKSGFISIYSNGDKKYLKILNFSKHQNPHKNERAAGSDIPDITENLSQVIDSKGLTINRDENGIDPDSDGTAPADSLLLIPDSLNPLTEVKTLVEFEDVWKMYGRKGNRKTSKARYSKLSESKRKAILKHIPDYVFSTPDKQYRKDFQAYLNQEAWNDEVITNAKNQPGTNATGHRQTVPERIKSAGAGYLARKEAEAKGNAEAVGSAGGDIRQQFCDTVRDGADRFMGETIDGDFSRADSDGVESIN